MPLTLLASFSMLSSASESLTWKSVSLSRLCRKILNTGTPKEAFRGIEIPGGALEGP